jgi:branched-chain amino acid transport system permease protein
VHLARLVEVVRRGLVVLQAHAGGGFSGDGRGAGVAPLGPDGQAAGPQPRTRAMPRRRCAASPPPARRGWPCWPRWLLLLPWRGRLALPRCWLIDLLVAALFAASLHFIMGPAGMHSFGHAAYFGLGAYAAALLVRAAGLPWRALVLAPLVAGWARWCTAGSACGCRACTWPCSRWRLRRSPGPCATSGTPDRRQQRPHRRVARDWLADKRPITGSRWPWWRGACCCCAGCCWRRLATPARGARLAAARRCHRHRCARVQWAALCWRAFCRPGGALYVFSKGSISPEAWPWASRWMAW